MEQNTVIPHTPQENLNINALTGLFTPSGFMEQARTFIPQIAPNSYCMAAIDILHFRLFNKFHGREVGNRLLRRIADCLEAVRREYGGVTGYFEGDNFCIVMPWKKDLVKRLRDDIQTSVDRLGGAMGVAPALGVSPLDDIELPPEIFYDRATLALSHAVNRDHVAYYEPGMETDLEEEMRLLMEVTEIGRASCRERVLIQV